jgi:hypothetical protein
VTTIFNTKQHLLTNNFETMVVCAVNGFGRIGRLVFRYAWDDP